jgi:hypothetical protein
MLIDHQEISSAVLIHRADSAGPSWLTVLGHAKDSLWCLDLFRCESAVLRTQPGAVDLPDPRHRTRGAGQRKPLSGDRYRLEQGRQHVRCRRLRQLTRGEVRQGWQLRQGSPNQDRVHQGESVRATPRWLPFPRDSTTTSFGERQPRRRPSRSGVTACEERRLSLASNASTCQTCSGRPPGERAP